LLAAAILVAGAAFMVAWVSTSAAVMLLGFFCCGLGVGLHFPLAIGRCVRASGGHPDQATARGSLGAGLASGGAPFVLAALADRAGVHVAFLTVPVLLAVALTVLLLRPVPAVVD
jgi:fucose permease